MRYVMCIVLTALASTADVHAEAIRCDTCRTDAELLQEARAAGPGRHLVFNLDTNLVAAWNISDTGVRPMAVPDGALVELEQAHRVWVAAGRTLQPTYEVDLHFIPGLQPSLLDTRGENFAWDYNRRSMILDRLSDGDFLAELAGPELTDALQPFVLAALSEFEFRIALRLADGAVVDVGIPLVGPARVLD